jgi:hypothetical protein
VWDIEVTDEFVAWWDSLDEDFQEPLDTVVRRLAMFGPILGRPFVDHVKGSRHHNMKELRADSPGYHLRVLFAFDPRRTAILLIGGDKSGDWSRWYTTFIPIADHLYDTHLQEIEGSP